MSRIAIVAWTLIAHLLVGLTTTGLSADQSEILTVGSKAPPLKIQQWFAQSDGQTRPVTEFIPGKVYVIEFWATWCGPCLQNLPHLAQLQREYAEKGVTIVGITNEELETVNEFLKREVPKRGPATTDSPQTYGQLTSVYSIAIDQGDVTMRSYMQAALQASIPCAFIVGKTGLIEWIGNPAAMDQPLREVVTGTWQRDAFGQEFLAAQHAIRIRTELNNALQRREYAQAIELINARLKESVQPQEQLELRLTTIQIALAQKEMPTAVARLKETLASTGGRTDMIDLICWHIYEQSEQRRDDLMPLVQVALAEGEKALPGAAKENLASLLDTVAHLAHKAGQKEKAIELVTRAIEVAEGENKEFSKQFLEELKK